MQLTDTHSHLYLDDFNEDLEPVLNRSVEADVTRILLPAIDWQSLKKMEKLHHEDIDFHKMMGIHPCEVVTSRLNEEERLLDVCSSDDMVGVGETGLDYYWSTDFVEFQKESLRMHCRVAKAVQKPIVLHNREATNDLLDIIEQEQDGHLTGVWHCFTGSTEEGERALDMGLHLGIGGVSTFKNAGVDEVVAGMPLDRLILETDAPYLSPEPKRGKRNEPSFMRYTAEKLADLKGISLERIASKTTETALDLFKLR
ncbi:TatD family hydrolase [Rhodohalobacter sp. 8-1]|uniref:TatD family hydrolase n=1 Tax=Rhodohalobacter sp. 8-1 TaxID=3131972 RepID=UPI0030EDC427